MITFNKHLNGILEEKQYWAKIPFGLMNPQQDKKKFFLMYSIDIQTHHGKTAEIQRQKNPKSK